MWNRLLFTAFRGHALARSRRMRATLPSMINIIHPMFFVVPTHAPPHSHTYPASSSPANCPEHSAFLRSRDCLGQLVGIILARYKHTAITILASSPVQYRKECKIPSHVLYQLPSHMLGIYLASSPFGVGKPLVPARVCAISTPVQPGYHTVGLGYQLAMALGIFESSLASPRWFTVD